MNTLGKIVFPFSPHPNSFSHLFFIWEVKYINSCLISCCIFIFEWNKTSHQYSCWGLFQWLLPHVSWTLYILKTVLTLSYSCVPCLAAGSQYCIYFTPKTRFPPHLIRWWGAGSCSSSRSGFFSTWQGWGYAFCPRLKWSQSLLEQSKGKQQRGGTGQRSQGVGGES